MKNVLIVVSVSWLPIYIMRIFMNWYDPSEEQRLMELN